MLPLSSSSRKALTLQAARNRAPASQRREGAGRCIVVLALLAAVGLTASGAPWADDHDSAPFPTQRGLVIVGNRMENTGVGVYLGTGRVSDQGAVVEDNVFVNNAEAVRVRGARTAPWIRNNQMRDNVVGIKLQGMMADPTASQDDADAAISLIQGNVFRANGAGLINETTRAALLWLNDWGAPQPLSHSDVWQQRLLRLRLQQQLLEIPAQGWPMSFLRQENEPSDVLSLPFGLTELELLNRQADRVQGPVIFYRPPAAD